MRHLPLLGISPVAIQTSSQKLRGPGGHFSTGVSTGRARLLLFRLAVLELVVSRLAVGAPRRNTGLATVGSVNRPTCATHASTDTRPTTTTSACGTGAWVLSSSSLASRSPSP